MKPSAYLWGRGTPTWQFDNTANDSDRTYTVPAGKIWYMLAVWARLAATATVGNRYLSVDISPNGTNPIRAGQTAAITASTTNTILVSFTGMGDDFTIAAGVGQNAMPMVLTAGATVRIWDSAAVDANQDDLQEYVHYIEYDA